MFDNQPESNTKYGIQMFFKEQQSKFVRKILVEENRIVNCRQSALQLMSIEQNTTVDSMAAVKI